MFNIKRFFTAIGIVVFVILFIFATCGLGALLIIFLRRPKPRWVKLDNWAPEDPEPGYSYPEAKLDQFILELDSHKSGMFPEIPGSETIYIYGDTHGADINFLTIEKRLKTKDCTCVFLGDYLDRISGTFLSEGIKNLGGLLMLRKIYPEKLILLRGNHETCNKLDEMREALDKAIAEWVEDKKLWPHQIVNVQKKISDSLKKLPVGVLIKNPKLTICVHGCLTHDFMKLGREEYNRMDVSDARLTKLLWVSCREIQDVEGREAIPSEDVFKFMKENGIVNLVVGHSHTRKQVTDSDGRNIVCWENFLESKPDNLINIDGGNYTSEPWIVK